MLKYAVKTIKMCSKFTTKHTVKLINDSNHFTVKFYTKIFSTNNMETEKYAFLNFLRTLKIIVEGYAVKNYCSYLRKIGSL